MVGLNGTALAYLCLQVTIACGAGEVGYRYSRWYVSTVKSQGILLRSLILGIALTHVAIFAERGSWAYEGFVHTRALDLVREATFAAEYLRLIPIRMALILGIIVHLVPIWRIRYKHTAWQIACGVAFRVLAPSLVYIAALQVTGRLGCFLYNVCPTP